MKKSGSCTTAADDFFGTACQASSKTMRFFGGEVRLKLQKTLSISPQAEVAGSSRPHGFVQQLQACRLLPRATGGTQLKTRFGIKLSQHDRGHVVNQAVQGRATALGQGFDAAVFFVGQAYGQGGHVKSSFKKSSGETTRNAPKRNWAPGKSRKLRVTMAYSSKKNAALFPTPPNEVTN
jgi:hypothetical protein